MADPRTHLDTVEDTVLGPDRRSTLAYPGTPRWVKLLGLAALVLVVLVVLLHLSGIVGWPSAALHTMPAEHGVQQP